MLVRVGVKVRGGEGVERARPPYPPPASNLDASVILSPKGTVDKITCVQGLQRVKGGRRARSPPLPTSLLGIACLMVKPRTTVSIRYRQAGGEGRGARARPPPPPRLPLLVKAHAGSTAEGRRGG